MKKRNLFLTLGLALTLGAGVAGGLSLNRGEAKEVEAATSKTFYLDCTNYADFDTYDTVCLHLWGSTPGDKYYQATKAGDNYWSVEIDDISGFAGCEFKKCNSVSADHSSAVNLYWKLSWLGFPSDSFYYLANSADGDWVSTDNINWSAPNAWSLTGSSSAALSSHKFDADGYQFYATSVELEAGDVIQFTNGTLTTGYADLRDVGNGQTAKEKGLVKDNAGKVEVVKSGSYDIYVNCITGKVWMQQDAASEADHWAEDFLATGCSTATTGTMAKWSDHASSFGNLTEGAKEILKGEAHVDHETVVTGNVKLAVQRYDYVLERYGRTLYSDFMGRVDAGKVTPKDANPGFAINSVNTNDTIIPIIAVVSISLVVVASIFVIRRRKEQE